MKKGSRKNRRKGTKGSKKNRRKGKKNNHTHKKVSHKHNGNKKHNHKIDNAHYDLNLVVGDHNSVDNKHIVSKIGGMEITPPPPRTRTPSPSPSSPLQPTISVRKSVEHINNSVKDRNNTFTIATDNNIKVGNTNVTYLTKGKKEDTQIQEILDFSIDNLVTEHFSLVSI